VSSAANQEVAHFRQDDHFRSGAKIDPLAGRPPVMPIGEAPSDWELQRQNRWLWFTDGSTERTLRLKSLERDFGKRAFRFCEREYSSLKKPNLNGKRDFYGTLT
jgi:hypothetical protein